MIHLDVYGTLVAATLVLLLGRQNGTKIPFLTKYTIPEPVAGGLLVALGFLLLKQTTGFEVSFDMSLKDPLMLAFLPPSALTQT